MERATCDHHPFFPRQTTGRWNQRQSCSFFTAFDSLPKRQPAVGESDTSLIDWSVVFLVLGKDDAVTVTPIQLIFRRRGSSAHGPLGCPILPPFLFSASTSIVDFVRWCHVHPFSSRKKKRFRVPNPCLHSIKVGRNWLAAAPPSAPRSYPCTNERLSGRAVF